MVVSGSPVPFVESLWWLLEATQVTLGPHFMEETVVTQGEGDRIQIKLAIQAAGSSFCQATEKEGRRAKMTSEWTHRIPGQVCS